MSEIHSRDIQERSRKQNALNSARDAISQLGFDAIVVVATYQDETGGSVALYSNSGNWYAQNGLMQYMLTMRKTDAVLDARRNDLRRGE